MAGTSSSKVKPASRMIGSSAVGSAARRALSSGLMAWPIITPKSQLTVAGPPVAGS